MRHCSLISQSPADALFCRYNDLVEEWRTGEPVQVCEKGAWEDEYAQMHAEMLSGDREASLMEYVCHQGEYCGGFADRYVMFVSLQCNASS